tara:strand:+ start:6343 stop:6543 length:201 start_codon:yes stop_codon:yes gene_type:complete
MNNINISIITLKKNNDKEFLRTFNSIKSQKREFLIEWIIVDGSDFKSQKKTKELINKFFSKEKKNF